MSKGRILVVDDDEAQRRMFMRAFTETGFEVDLAASADEARNLLAKNRYDLILLDLVLKTERCGLELLAWLKANDSLKNIPVIAMSGHHLGHPLLLEAYDAGARDAVSKPLAMKLMMRKAEDFITEAQKTVQPAKRAKGRVKTLVIEDDPAVCDLYEAFFKHYADEFAYVLVDTGEKALRELEKHTHEPFDVALIDWTLARGSLDGYQILKKIRSRSETRDILAFMVTGNENPQDVEAAFDAGADDYVAKPFRDGELAARLRSRLRRRDEGMDKCCAFELEGLRFDRQSDGVTLDGKLVSLTGKERALLCLFLSRPDRVLSSEHIWNLIWGYTSKTTAVVLSKHIGNLRKKLGTWGNRIEARCSTGYLLNSRFPATH